MGVPSHQLAKLAASYLAALRSGDRAAALLIAREALAAGLPLHNLYQDLLQPALYEVGRLWECGQMDVAEEHAATAITRSVMELCSNKLKPLPSGPPTVLATCIGPELHDTGMRMVADCLELNGWNTLYLGANMPLDAIVELAVRHRVAVVAASITLGSHALGARDLIESLRQSPLGRDVKVLVGGQPFNRVPELWRQLGADGTAQNAHSAVAWVDRHIPRQRSDHAGHGSLGPGAHDP